MSKKEKEEAPKTFRTFKDGEAKKTIEYAENKGINLNPSDMPEEFTHYLHLFQAKYLREHDEILSNAKAVMVAFGIAMSAYNLKNDWRWKDPQQEKPITNK